MLQSRPVLAFVWSDDPDTVGLDAWMSARRDAPPRSAVAAFVASSGPGLARRGVQR